MDVHEHILLTEMERCIKRGERRGQIARDLAAARLLRRSTLRPRVARLLVALADRLSPDAVLAFEANKPRLHT